MNLLLLADFGTDIHVTTTKSATHQEAFFKIPNLKFFEGHFPETPILPAFATLEISFALGRKLDLLSTVKKVTNAKFISAIKEGDSIKVIIKKDPTGVDFEWQQLQGTEWKKASEISVE